MTTHLQYNGVTLTGKIVIPRDHKVEAMIKLLPRLRDCLDYKQRHGHPNFSMPLPELRTIVLGLEALEAPLL